MGLCEGLGECRSYSSTFDSLCWAPLGPAFEGGDGVLKPEVVADVWPSARLRSGPESRWADIRFWDMCVSFFVCLFVCL